MPIETEKLQKVLARLGLGSRRQMETWIDEGRVKINKRLAKVGDRVSYRDVLRLDGKRLEPEGRRKPLVLCYNKPVSEVCSRDDPEKRKTVFESLPELSNGRWISVGRLDLNTSGLLLFTNDGDLANQLMHPSHNVEREYAVRIFGRVSDAQIKILKKGVVLDDGPARFEQIKDAGGEGSNHWYHVILKEGRNREVRRLWESQNVQVSRLTRLRYGPVWLPRDLRLGQTVMLKPGQVNDLLVKADITIAEPEQHTTKQARGGHKKRLKPSTIGNKAGKRLNLRRRR
jgi:23S rRNA pseudouridine2605 synthase